MKKYIIIAILLNTLFLAVYSDDNISSGQGFAVCKEKAVKLSQTGKYGEAIKIMETWFDKADKTKINADIVEACKMILLTAEYGVKDTKMMVTWTERLLSFLNRKEVIDDNKLTEDICFRAAWAIRGLKDQKIKERLYGKLIVYRRKKLNEAQKTKQTWVILHCYENLIDLLAEAKQTQEAIAKSEEAIKYYEKIIKKNPYLYTSVYTTLSKLYVEDKEYSKAIKVLERFMSVYNKRIAADMYIKIAQIYLESKDTVNTQKALEKAVLSNTPASERKRDDIQSAFLEIGKVYCAMEQYELAVKYIERSGKGKYLYVADMADAYFYWGKSLQTQEKNKQAADKFENAYKYALKADMSPMHLGQILLNLGLCNMNLNNYKKAEKYFLKSLEPFNNINENKLFWEGTVYLYLARNARYHKKWQEAEKYYEKSVDLLEKCLASLRDKPNKQTEESAFEGLCLAYKWLQTCFYYNKVLDKSLTVYCKFKSLTKDCKFDKMPEHNLICVVDVYPPLVANYIDLKEYKQASQLIAEGKAIVEFLPSSSQCQQLLATFCYLEAKVLFFSGDKSKAIEKCKKVLAFFKKASPDSDITTIISQNLKKWEKSIESSKN